MRALAVPRSLNHLVAILAPAALVLVAAVLVPVFRSVHVSVPLLSTDALVPAQAVLDRDFAEARAEAAHADRAGLIVDVSTGIVTLTQDGMPVRTRPAVRMQVPGVREWRDRPSGFVLQDLDGTLPHVPVRIVEAPRTVDEAAAQSPTLPPVISSEMTSRLSYHPHLDLMLVSSSCGGACRRSTALLALRTSIRDAYQTSVELVTGHIPSHRPQIVLVLEPNDVRAIYRALEAGSPLSVRWAAERPAEILSTR